jgi:hypothetical protein
MESERPEYVVYRAAKPITVDGVLDEPSWRGANVMNLVLADTGKPPRQPTTARALWDDKYLYIAFECQDTDIWGTITERDKAIFAEEVVEIFIDEDRDNWGYLEFEVSPRNAVLDIFIINRDGRVKGLWDWNSEGWLTAVKVVGDPTRRGTDDKSWTVEMAIPMADFMMAPNLPPKPGDVWHANFYRIDRAVSGDEWSAFAPIGKINFHSPEKFGRIVFSDKSV